MLNALLKICALIILVGVIVHGYLFIRYGSAHPCQAAQTKLASGSNSSLSELQTLNGSNPIACYQFVFIGEDPKNNNNENSDTGNSSRY